MTFLMCAISVHSGTFSRLWEGGRLIRGHEKERDERDRRRIAMLALKAKQDISGSVLYAGGQLLPADKLQQALHHSL